MNDMFIRGIKINWGKVDKSNYIRDILLVKSQPV